MAVLRVSGMQNGFFMSKTIAARYATQGALWAWMWEAGNVGYRYYF